MKIVCVVLFGVLVWISIDMVESTPTNHAQPHSNARVESIPTDQTIHHPTDFAESDPTRHDQRHSTAHVESIPTHHPETTAVVERGQQTQVEKKSRLDKAGDIIEKLPPGNHFLTHFICKNCVTM